VLKRRLTAPLVNEAALTTSTARLKVTVPGAPLVFKVTFGALTIKPGGVAPAGNVTVRAADPEISRVTSPPSKVEAIETAPRASMVEPLLTVIRPSVKVN